jgi:hypothetical protein
VLFQALWVHGIQRVQPYRERGVRLVELSHRRGGGLLRILLSQVQLYLRLRRGVALQRWTRKANKSL